MAKHTSKGVEALAVEALGDFVSPDLQKIIREAALRYGGTADVLETAIGALVMGQLYGWQVLRMIHSSYSYSKYQRILGVSFKDVCPARGPLSGRSVGLKVADTLGSFWKVATRDIPGASLVLDGPATA